MATDPTTDSQGLTMRDRTHHRRTWAAGVALALGVAGPLALPSSAAAAGKPPKTVYAVDYAPSSTLYKLKPRSKKVKVIGNTGRELTDVAFRGKKLYAVGFSTLYRLDPRTGAGTIVGPLGLSDANALTVRKSTKVLYGAGDNGSFFKVNHKTGAAKLIGSLGSGWGSSGDLAFIGKKLYASVHPLGSTASSLAKVNLRTGKAKIIGSIGFANVYGLVSRKNRLYGATFDGRWLTISTTTGKGKARWNNGVFVGGLTVR